jgi:hypothetical protein
VRKPADVIARSPGPTGLRRPGGPPPVSLRSFSVTSRDSPGRRWTRLWRAGCRRQPEARGAYRPAVSSCLRQRNIAPALRRLVFAEVVLRTTPSSRGREAEPGIQNRCRIRGLHRRWLWIPGSPAAPRDDRVDADADAEIWASWKGDLRTRSPFQVRIVPAAITPGENRARHRIWAAIQTPSKGWD